MKNPTLRKGYTTGVHSSFAFKNALESFISTSQPSNSITNKIDNDDLDVTKGCEITVTISDNLKDLVLNQIPHKPYILKSQTNICKIYAGTGVGVVTKHGLKPPKDYPAINPVPLEYLQELFQKATIYKNNLTLFCAIGVTNGKQIALKTANAKVGILGGISILGTTGWVKPISSTAYIHSIETELNFAKQNSFDTIIFTLGNSSYTKAKQNQTSKSYIIEIGNFIYDGIKLALDVGFDNIILYTGVAKSVKIAQGFKNTHNRFGSIDFTKVQQLVKIDIQDATTIKRVQELLQDKQKEDFEILVKTKAQEQLKKWFNYDIVCVVVV